MSLFPRDSRTPEPTPHEIAADWLLREEQGALSPQDRAARDAWLDAREGHREVMEDVRLALVTAAEGAADPEMMAMRAQALHALPQVHIVTARRAVAAVLAAVVLGAGGWWALHGLGAGPGAAGSTASVQASDPDTALYRTAVGERSAITLPDGSIVTLDTDSAMKVAFTGAERGVRLLRGQALFEVAKHKPQPFQVYAGDRRITAVGTKFDVRLSGAGQRSKVTVALVEGVVKVAALKPTRDKAAPQAVVTMAAGELLEAKVGEPVTVVTADTERVTSWRAGFLTFDDMPLGQAVAEMNRYTTRPIVLADPGLARLHISGVFKTGDPDHFADTVSQALPVRVGHRPDGAPELTAR